MFRCGVLAAVLAALAVALCACPEPADVGLSADGYQLLSLKVVPESWTEWWFFTVIDAENDLGLAFGFGAPKGGKGQAGMNAMWYANATQKDKASVSINVSPAAFFSAARENASVSMDLGQIIPVSSDEYRVVVRLPASAGSAAMSMDLVFRRDPGAYPDKEEENLLDDLVRLDWVSFMPAASVSGTVQLGGGRVVTLSGKSRGYHDHNYGRWPTRLFNWLWGSYSGVAASGALFSATYGAYLSPPFETTVAYIFLRYNGQRYKLGTLCFNPISVKPTAFKRWTDGRKYATAYHIEAENDELRLVWDFETVNTYLNPGGTPLGLEVFEQISMHNATLYEKRGSQWALKDAFLPALGFNEWSDTTF